MKPNPVRKGLSLHITKSGPVKISENRKLIAFITPEIFTEGWAKNIPKDRLKAPGFQGIIPLVGGGKVGLNTSVKGSHSGIKLRFALTPLINVKVIHIRLVVNLPYKSWQGCPYHLGSKSGRVRIPSLKNDKLDEGQSAPLTLGPSAVHHGLILELKAPGLHTVLQDNRQWTPFLHAFVTRNEPSDPAWHWKAGRIKVYQFSLNFHRKFSC
jgi:hypothetical protein